MYITIKTSFKSFPNNHLSYPIQPENSQILTYENQPAAYMTSSFHRSERQNGTVDGRNPAPPGM